MTPPRAPIGNSELVGWLKHLLEYIKSIELAPGKGYKLKRAGGKTLLEIDTQSSPRRKRFALAAVYGDYLECNPKAGTLTDTATTVYIAKNPKLRTSIIVETLDGTAHSYSYTGYIQRDAVFSGTTETQYVVPRYLTSPQDEIFADYISAGTGVQDGSANELYWMDANVDARAWAADVA